MFKKFLAGCLATTMVVAMAVPAFAAEADLTKNKDNKLIYCITPSTSNPYFGTIQDATKAKGEELGYTVKSGIHDDDATKQNELFDTAISEGASFIICDNAGADASIEAAKKATDAGIAVFMVDREINEDGICAGQLVADNSQGATEAAEYLVEMTEGKGKYAELLGLESDTNCQVRSDAFHSVIDDTEMEMVAQQSANWDQTEGQAKTETILQSNPDIVAIVCGNDTMACGAAAAVKSANLDHEVFIIGVDGSNDMRDNIKEGLTTATALQQIDLITRTAVEEGNKLMTEGTTGAEEKQLIPCQLITKDNADKLDNFVFTE